LQGFDKAYWSECNGYVDPGGFGSYLSFNINAPASTGDHKNAVRYATKDARPLDLLVDGSKKHTFPCSGTGDWANWNTEKIVLSLNQGTHTLKLLASDSSGANIDRLSVRSPDETRPTSFPESIVLSSNQSLERGEFVFSPNGKFKVGLTSAGDLVLQNDLSRTIWNAKVSGGFRCYMQGDGNLIVRQSNNKPIWESETSQNADARLVVDDGGRIAVVHDSTPLWVDGIPREKHES
jgi:hypothetical protein